MPVKKLKEAMDVARKENKFDKKRIDEVFNKLLGFNSKRDFLKK